MLSKSRRFLIGKLNDWETNGRISVKMNRAKTDDIYGAEIYNRARCIYGCESSTEVKVNGLLSITCSRTVNATLHVKAASCQSSISTLFLWTSETRPALETGSSRWFATRLH